MDNKAYVIAGTKNYEIIINEVWEFDGSSWVQRTNYSCQLITEGLGFNYGGFGFGWIDGLKNF